MTTYDNSVLDLIRGAVADARDLIREEVALARAELRQEASRLATAAAVFAGAAVVGLLALAAACAAAAIGLADLFEWPLWLGYAVVSAALLLGAGILALIGRRNLRAHRPMPLTVETMKENAQWMRARTQ